MAVLELTGSGVGTQSQYQVNMDTPDASGLEADVFFRDGKAIKLYKEDDGNGHNVRQTRFDEDIEGKIAALQGLSHRCLVLPRGVVYENGERAGYWMDQVQQGESLVARMTPKGQEKANPPITRDDLEHFISSLSEAVEYLHANGVQACDLNENNILVVRTAAGKLEPRIIDTDSFQIRANGKEWLGQTVQEKIRDPRAAHGVFTDESDHFSLAVLSFNILAGYHPYQEVLEYMRNDCSVYKDQTAEDADKYVAKRVKRGHRDEAFIPKGLQGWFEAVFQNGDRSAMPDRSRWNEAYVANSAPLPARPAQSPVSSPAPQSPAPAPFSSPAPQSPAPAPFSSPAPQPPAPPPFGSSPPQPPAPPPFGSSPPQSPAPAPFSSPPPQSPAPAPFSSPAPQPPSPPPFGSSPPQPPSPPPVGSPPPQSPVSPPFGGSPPQPPVQPPSGGQPPQSPVPPPPNNGRGQNWRQRMGRNSTQNQTSNNDASYMWAAAAGAAAVGAAVGASKSYEEENKEAVYNNAVLGGGRKPDRTGSIFRTVLAVALGATAVYLGVQVNQSRSR